MTKPPQIPCRCAARIFPHRRDQYCSLLAEQNEPTCLTSYERGVDERAEDRERARYINAVNRGVAK